MHTVCMRKVNPMHLAMYLSFCLVGLQLAAAYGASAAQPAVDERLIGWLGETYVKQPLGTKDDPSGMRIVSWDPRIAHYRRFLSDDECDYLIRTAQPRLTASGVSDSLTGIHKLSKVRTSSGMFFGRGEDPVVKRIEDRVAAWTFLPTENAEGMQVLRYVNGQRYDPHHDYFSHPERDANGGNRLATVLMYLTDVEEGGETLFPRVPRLPHQTLENGWSNCSLQGLALKPRKGDATLFWSIRPDGTFDHKSLHGSCPVIKGEKYSATKWIHVARFAVSGEKAQEVHRVIFAPPPPPVPSWCKDQRSECPVWAESGECQSNPGYMVGDRSQPGACLVSCARCDLLPTPPAATTATRRMLQGNGR